MSGHFDLHTLSNLYQQQHNQEQFLCLEACDLYLDFQDTILDHPSLELIN